MNSRADFLSLISEPRVARGKSLKHLRLFSFIEAFVFEQQVLYRAYFLSVTRP